MIYIDPALKKIKTPTITQNDGRYQVELDGRVLFAHHDIVIVRNWLRAKYPVSEPGGYFPVKALGA